LVSLGVPNLGLFESTHLKSIPKPHSIIMSSIEIAILEIFGVTSMFGQTHFGPSMVAGWVMWMATMNSSGALPVGRWWAW
jgi:hypothetical protein